VTFILSTKIGRTPHRDRSTSGSRSVALRTQIGPNPRRDRSTSRLTNRSRRGTGPISRYAARYGIELPAGMIGEFIGPDGEAR